jgi:hypothetical protein
MNRTSPPNQEIWVAGDSRSEVLEILRGLGKQFNLTVYYNGVKIHEEEKRDG